MEGAAATIDIDTGGTFTDAFVRRGDEVATVKVLTTPHDLAVCFRDVLEAAAGALGTDVPALLRETAVVRYATTVGTNALIQRSGPRLGLIADAPGADAGRRGIGVFVEPEMVRAPEAAAATGTELPEVRELLDAGARGLVAALDGEPAREGELRERFEELYPHNCLDTVPLLLAGEITPDRDPDRRAATALFNAYVHPDVAGYLYRAEDHLRDQGYTRPLLIVHNDGGCTRVAKTIAAKTYNSGPMAGLLGARAIAEQYGITTLVTLDMGGTSLDVSVLEAGEIPMLAHGRVEGVEVAMALPDLVPLGAGGGSIAWLEDGVLRVGPQSAGAKPGPACFGFGGERPTVTDADVVLGILRPDAFLGGAMAIDADAARRAIATLAEPLGCEPEEAAEQVRATVHRETGAQLAALLAERGIDTAGAAVLAFGGNGATHCAGIAQAAGIAQVITVPFSPVFSAFGASRADVRHRCEAPAGDGAEERLRRRALRDMRGEGFAEAEVTLSAREEDRDGVRWAVVDAVRELPHAALAAAPERGEAGPPREALVRWPGSGPLATPIVRRDGLGPGDTLPGPLLVDSPTTTCAVPPGWTLTIDEHGAERLTREEGAR
ncbi:MAG: hydantoinase/oxoprolinase family protein [Solirubrobacteraceae bacterium]|jgi:N-methylhydantoinase A/oxoprolinase/acetone carboxylase beta subunit|nr:hydantoinase/oxoprolinase family protein [Solirubrobacteraceae bacterium]